MDFIVETVLDVVTEIASNAVETAVVSHKEKKRKKEQEEESNGSEEFDH